VVALVDAQVMLTAEFTVVVVAEIVAVTVGTGGAELPPPPPQPEIKAAQNETARMSRRTS